MVLLTNFELFAAFTDHKKSGRFLKGKIFFFLNLFDPFLAVMIA
jgi:hypothetical protein